MSTWKRSPEPTIRFTRSAPGVGALGMWRTRQRRPPRSRRTSSSWAATAATAGELAGSTAGRPKARRWSDGASAAASGRAIRGAGEPVAARTTGAARRRRGPEANAGPGEELCRARGRGSSAATAASLASVP